MKNEMDLETTTGFGSDESYSTLYNITYDLNVYALPVLLALGTMGNAFCMGTLRNEKFRLTSMGFLLSALAIADLASLYTGALRTWIDSTFRLDVRTVSNAACKLHTFFTYYSIHLSAWTLVLITLERLVAVLVPNSFNVICSRQRMMLSWVVIAVIIFVLNSYILDKIELSSTVMTGNIIVNCSTLYTTSCCMWKAESAELVSTYLYWSDFCLSCLLPTSFIVVGNILIGYQVYHHRVPGQGGRALLKNRARKSSVTTMLIVVSMAFVLTTLPINLFFLTKDYTAIDRYQEIMIHSVFSLLYYTNNAMNFFLYFVSGSRFRKAAKEFLQCSNRNATRRPFCKTTSMAQPYVHATPSASIITGKLSVCDSK